VFLAGDAEDPVYPLVFQCCDKQVRPFRHCFNPYVDGFDRSCADDLTVQTNRQLAAGQRNMKLRLIHNPIHDARAF
ncbi:MAG: hypothetical protein RIE60_11755, partial [Roseovarius sp.]|uniref:hypothetical protein n=1 Tax=Roseovarius sp. TaxID=1486281 RepID=UPI0032EDAC39